MVENVFKKCLSEMFYINFILIFVYAQWLELLLGMTMRVNRDLRNT